MVTSVIIIKRDSRVYQDCFLMVAIMGYYNTTNRIDFNYSGLATQIRTIITIFQDYLRMGNQ